MSINNIGVMIAAVVGIYLLKDYTWTKFAIVILAMAAFMNGS
ncbi:Uncharacterised protein [Sebaldella termitidis]|uniref:Uncharacterized protein n=1 Tax=Sebaldella termitidis (strain ATCC 33386 / NCTC 11300) TaxID=526218 RepID=D1AN93_SEBTE|nr:hypothetical protein [Sebaldella termitidis]ACZ09697.1 hypothetical protein Sterm_2853 [Sebaldella termitidis ATCC 33386]SUI25028.1 Uncharacterised protein [Sebaldella termitidis]